MDGPHRGRHSGGTGHGRITRPPGRVKLQSPIGSPPPLRRFPVQLYTTALNKMERAARLLKKNKYSRRMISDDDIIRGLWPLAVGKAIARHTGKLTIVRKTLVVEVEDAIWQKQLFCLSRQIVDRVQKIMGNSDIEEVEFRVGIPRRPPQKAESLEVFAGDEGGNRGDGADGIQDAVLKKIYRLSRKRATA